MRIKNQELLIDVYAVYWVNGDTLFLGMPKNYGGLLAYDSRQIEVIEHNLSGNFIYFQNNGINGIYHSALIQEKLLDDILELDETAYRRFLKILKAEGSIAQDFY
ncbi:hypothetical protein [Photorhabdus khanii]|uniref:Uncharacterized protein n=1 Tax=Photorhabdus khanii subsp. guanajuatensis TaxID=2100166 RepID=A0A4R4JDG0_9GAMM|nr:hypothetical protein [Photorhabdus khanii]TDB52078.1 hypothetical protein C5467_16175 [Photorhabdus khanii subsp. guanajuatensis]